MSRLHPDPAALASEILRSCLENRPTPGRLYDLLLRLCREPATAQVASRAFFGVLVEGLADRFEPALNVRYADLMAQAIATLVPDTTAPQLLSRYAHLRTIRPFSGPEPSVVYVLSRVTLGADVAITSVVLDGLKRRFRHAEVVFVGPAKNFALFAADTRLSHLPLPYSRGGTLADRLSQGLMLRQLLGAPDLIVVDPDSRLTQTGLLPVFPAERVYFFESRGFGGHRPDPLSALTAEWMRAVFQVEAGSFLAPRHSPLPIPNGRPITISFGVGENAAKRLGAAFEAGLLSAVERFGEPVVVDAGGGGEEAERVNGAITASHCTHCTVWSGDFATFAAQIAASRLFIGYDSAGGHVAAVTRVPGISILRGAVSARFAARWRPVGCRVLDGEQNPADVLSDVATALADLLTASRY